MLRVTGSYDDLFLTTMNYVYVGFDYTGMCASCKNTNTKFCHKYLLNLYELDW